MDEYAQGGCMNQSLKGIIDAVNGNNPPSVGLVIPGGGLRGVVPAGMFIALWLMKLTHLIKWTASVSTGSCVNLYGFSGAGEAIMGTSIYPNECCSKNFFNPRRIAGGNILDLVYLEHQVMRKTKPPQLAALFSSPAEIRFGVTDAQTGEGHLIDVKKSAEDPIRVAMASSNIIPLYKETISINGIPAADGSFYYSDSALAAEAISQLPPVSDVFFLATDTSGMQDDFSWAAKLAIRAFSQHPGLHVAIKSRQERARQAQRFLERMESPRLHVFRPETMPFGLFEQKPEMLRQAVYGAARLMFTQFGRSYQHFDLP